KDMIQIVVQIPSGKRVTTYYGRSSKVCVTSGSSKKYHHEVLHSDEFVNLLHALNPKITDNEITTMLQELESIQTWDYSAFELWSKKEGSQIFDIDIDMRELANFTSILYRFNPSVGLGLEKLAKYLNFNLVGVHTIPDELIRKYTQDNYEAGELTKESLFEYWRQIPIIKMLSLSNKKKAFGDDLKKHGDKGNIIRSGVLAILREGIEDTDSKGTVRKRYLLTAKEILDGVNKNLEKMKKPKITQIKRANLYFHLDKLENAEYIRVAGYITRGTAQRVTYYGRTARAISTTNFEGSVTYPIIRSEGLRNLIHRMNPGIDSDEVELLLGKIDFINDYSEATLPIWVERNERVLEGVEIDLVRLGGIISLLRRFNSDVIEGLKQLADLIHFKQAA
ncbi:MAG: hypothetical protein ACXAC2_06710, partial [Candidatus Kariarchaeaceae archaeon]